MAMNFFTNFTELASGTHAIFESSLLRSTIAGHINDVLVVQETGTGANITRTPIDADNGTAVCVKGFTHNGKGLQERYATIAGVKDKISVLGTPELIKDAQNSYYENPAFFYNKAGVDAKAYEVEGDENGNGDIFGVTTEGFVASSLTNLVEDAYVVVDGNGKYTLLAAKPTASNYGFIGQVHSIYKNNFYTLVRIYVLQNVDNN